jgi:uncharacterized NAD(P)/FAD-binding protein YdhS
MSVSALRVDSSDRLSELVIKLESLRGRLSETAIIDAVETSGVRIEDVAPFILPTPHPYGRRRVARTDDFEVLVMTWLPGQCTGVHDHAGAASVFKILQGTAREMIFEQKPDSLVRPHTSRQLHLGDIGCDAGSVIHEVNNDSDAELPLVSLHVYAPPLPEMRRFARRSERHESVAAFRRGCDPSTPVIAIVGGGFSGTMVAAQVARRSAQLARPLHLVLVDRQTSIGEGAAYRTPDASHLLNVPAYGMSAWPDRPNDFLDWLRQRDPDIAPYSFLERRAYGEYLRDALFEALSQSDRLTIEVRREEIECIERRAGGGWSFRCQQGAALEADAVVLATGHRPPDDPLAERWTGARARYVQDPWAALALASIEPHESVCLLGTGLTAIDVLQSLSKTTRSGVVAALSRRGLLPCAHAQSPVSPVDPAAWLEPMLSGQPNTVQVLTRALRGEMRQAQAAHGDWRGVIDGLRPYVARIWQSLPRVERQRFMRHARTFWEVMRHRMAPEVAANVRALSQAGLFQHMAARILTGEGDCDGVTLTICGRGEVVPVTVHFDWIVNCTGPGSVRGHALSPVLTDLIRSGYLEEDELGLGVRSTADGHAFAQGRRIDDMIVVGTLRKPDLWESTAVPELRQQAAAAAEAILALTAAGLPTRTSK